MHRVGFERFAIVGHDRGSYTAFRAAMDHPAAITHRVVLDGVPILEARERCDDRFASACGTGSFSPSPENQSAPKGKS